MTRLSLLLASLVVALFAFPFLYARQRHETYRNFRVVEDGVLYRSGQMSPSGIARVCREKGIKTVISLRDEGKQADDVQDEEAVCRNAGVLEYETIPPKGWEEDGTGMVPMTANLDRFLLNLEAKTEDPKTGELTPVYPRPILIHCFAGIHRTGAHVAVYRVRYHRYTPAEAVAELKACGKPTTTYVGNLIPFLSTRYLPELYERVHGVPVGGAGGGR
jgi:protein tyrosine/serine phosphatase